MGTKTDPFDIFLEKNFSGSPRVRIAKPVGGERDTSYEQRREEAERQRAEENVGEPAAVGEGSAVPAAEAAPDTSVQVAPVPVPETRRPGRPKSAKGPVHNINFLLEVDVKQKLDQLKLDLCRTSVTDLFKEAIHDLFVKYHVIEG